MKSVLTKKEWTESILKQYFTVEGNLLTVDLYYDTFSMLIDQNMGNDQVEKLNDTLFEKIDEVLALVPKKYKLNILVHIQDLENYNLEEANHIIKNNIMLKLYRIALQRKKKRVTGLSLLFGGVVLLLTSYFLSRLEWPQIIFDIINISGTLLIWEAANITLIERSEEMRHLKNYIKKLKEIQLVEEK